MGYKESVLQRRLCSNSPGAHCQWPVEGTVMIPWNLGGHNHHLHNLSSTKVLWRLGAGTGAARGMVFLLELQRLDSGQVSISATKLALPHLAAAAALPKSFFVAQYYSLWASHLSPSVVRQHLLSHRSFTGLQQEVFMELQNHGLVWVARQLKDQLGFRDVFLQSLAEF